MNKTDILSRAIFNVILWIIPAFAVGAMAFDLYVKGVSSPFASLISAFIGLYVGFLAVWKLFCLMDFIATWMIDTKREFAKNARLSQAVSA
jgi:hypothetical protein